MISNVSELTTHQKALAINLNPQIYGTFAEIGAGQEVVRWFFRVGGAAGTVTKSMSAYDMHVSDAIYGKSDRYVSVHRLNQMLDHEYALNIERLSSLNKSLFAFADTIAAKSFKGNNEQHGWMGLRFQTEPNAAPSQIILHLRLLDKDAVAQQEALGVIGVNLLYAAYYIQKENEKLILSLVDELSVERVQIDMIEFSGEAFKKTDNRLKTLFLVKHNLCDIAMFDANGKVLQPSEVLYKRPIIIERGTFRPVTNIHLNLLESCKKAFLDDFPECHDSLLTYMEVTMKNLLETSEADPKDFLSRADTLAAIGQPVIISKYSEFYKLSSYLKKYTSQPIAFAIGGASLRNIFNENDYQDLEGGFLEAMSRLFRKNVRAYVYPQMMPDKSLLNTQTFIPQASIELIYKHLIQNKNLRDIDIQPSLTSSYSSRHVLQLMKDGDDSWQKLVPKAVADAIINNNLFDYTRK